MNPLVKEVRREFSRWWHVVLDTEHDECAKGSMLAVTEVPGDETLCRVSLIGESGRCTGVYNTLALLTELVQMPNYRWPEPINILENKLTPMTEVVTKDGTRMVNNLPEEGKGIANGRRIRHIC